MNRSDIKLVVILVLIVVIFLIVLNLNKKTGVAVVYYEDKEILRINLDIDKEYVVEGELGDVVLEVKDKMIRVKEENSLNHICSLEGYIKDSTRSLICMPNKIVVKISDDLDIDEVVY